MEINIVKGSAEGPTTLAAFDNCLINMGVANYNLIYLSSIIPPGSTISFEPPKVDGNEFGKRLYVVIAQQRALEPNKQAWAGIGWVQAPDGRGLFVEHHGFSHEQVEGDLRTTLNHMIQTRPHEQWGEIQTVTEGVTCKVNPVCACVVAVYKSESW